MGLTLGHGEQDWSDPVFRDLLTGGVNYLSGQ